MKDRGERAVGGLKSLVTPFQNPRATEPCARAAKRQGALVVRNGFSVCVATVAVRAGGRGREGQAGDWALSRQTGRDRKEEKSGRALADSARPMLQLRKRVTVEADG